MHASQDHPLQHTQVIARVSVFKISTSGTGGAQSRGL